MCLSGASDIIFGKSVASSKADNMASVTISSQYCNSTHHGKFQLQSEDQPEVDN